jgi:ParB family chromosome partitioning protein
MAAPKRNALGKGLSALLKETSGTVEQKRERVNTIVRSIAEIELSKIEENPFQPRTNFDKEAIEELSNSIKELGVIQPITVRALAEDRFQLISGERRLRASKAAGLTTVPAYIRTANDQEMLEMALVENIQREELDPIEVALSYQRLIEECELTQEKMSERVGKKRSTVANFLRLLKLQPILQAGLRDKMMSMGHARALINVADEDAQLSLYEDIVGKGLSVRQVEEAVRRMKSKNSVKTKASTKGKDLAPRYLKMRKNLSELLDAQVDLNRTKRGSGKIVIPFKSDEELERIFNLLES